MFSERIVLRGGPGNNRAYHFADPRPIIEFTATTRYNWWDEDLNDPSFQIYQYERTHEIDKWGKRIYRVRK